jgi:hypothetical protein
MNQNSFNIDGVSCQVPLDLCNIEKAQLGREIILIKCHINNKCQLSLTGTQESAKPRLLDPQDKKLDPPYLVNLCLCRKINIRRPRA